VPDLCCSRFSQRTSVSRVALGEWNTPN
jgi:hypothetical protein